MTWDFKFKCTGCGRCCDSSPSIFMNELEENSEWMLFRPSLRIEEVVQRPSDVISIVPSNCRDQKTVEATFSALRNRQLTYGTPVHGKFRKRKFVAYWSISDIFMGHMNRCPVRGEDMSCTVYDRRPLICRTVPFNEIMRGKALKSNLEKFVSYPGYECDTSEKAPVIIKDGKIINDSFRDARAAMSKGRSEHDVSWIPAATSSSLVWMHEIMGIDDNLMIESCLDGNPGIGAPLGVLLLGMVTTKNIDKEKFLRILENQCAASEERLHKLSGDPILDRTAPEESSVYTKSFDMSTWRQYIKSITSSSRHMMTAPV